MGLVVKDDGWRIPDALWQRIEPLLPTGILVAWPAATAGRPQDLCLDKGYDHNEVRELAGGFGFTLHVRTRGEEIRHSPMKSAFARGAGARCWDPAPPVARHNKWR